MWLEGLKKNDEKYHEDGWSGVNIETIDHYLLETCAWNKYDPLEKIDYTSWAGSATLET